MTKPTMTPPESTEPRTAARDETVLAFQALRHAKIEANAARNQYDRNSERWRFWNGVVQAISAALATIAPTEPGPAAQEDVPRLIDELEEAHSRLCETFHIFGEGAETDRQRGYYREAKARLIAAAERAATGGA